MTMNEVINSRIKRIENICKLEENKGALTSVLSTDQWIIDKDGVISHYWMSYDCDKNEFNVELIGQKRK